MPHTAARLRKLHVSHQALAVWLALAETGVLIEPDNLPVVREGSVKGIISDRDIFEVLVGITGVRHGGHRIFMMVKDTPKAGFSPPH